MSRAPYVSLHIAPVEGQRHVRAADIVLTVEREVRAGRVPRGSRLPPVRALERQLGLSKNTAQAAYDELSARGLLETREREGVFVIAPADTAPRPDSAFPSNTASPSNTVSPANTASPSNTASPPAAEDPLPPTPLLAPRLHTRDTPRIPTGQRPQGAISLSSVFIDQALLPKERLSDCARSVLKNPRHSAYYDAQGDMRLRELIAARLRARGIFTEASCVITTTGSQQALDMVARATARRSVGLESPVYPHARFLFETHGLATVPLRLDPFGGIDLDAWASTLRAARPGFVYSITSFQNPTGYSYTSHELTRLLAIARDNDIALVEDDWGSEMLSGSEYRPTLRAMGGPGVLYVGSFTKKLWPSLRVGFIVADPETAPLLLAMKRVATLANAWLTEAIVAEFLERGYYDTHLTATQQELDRRYEACLSCLDELMPSDVRWTTPGGGPTLWLELPRRVPLADLAARVRARGVDIEDTKDTFVEPTPHLHGFRVSYAFSPIDTVRRGLSVVAEEMRRFA